MKNKEMKSRSPDLSRDVPNISEYYLFSLADPKMHDMGILQAVVHVPVSLALKTTLPSASNTLYWMGSALTTAKEGRMYYHLKLQYLYCSC